MPLYEYECTDCKHRLELLQRHGDPPPDSCPRCGGRMHKLFSAPAVQFKGTGWYVTDYAGKGKKPAATAGETAKDSSSGGKQDSSAKSTAKADKKSGGSD